MRKLDISPTAPCRVSGVSDNAAFQGSDILSATGWSMEKSQYEKMRAFPGAFLMCGQFISAQSESGVRDRIVGTWKLVSTELTMEDGTTRPFPQFGANGKGFLMYARDGYMCAFLVNPDRPKWVDSNQPTPDEKVAAWEGAFAYCGRYEIDVKQNRIIHLPEVATDPGYVGSRQIRPYKFEDGRLVLSDVEVQQPGVAHWKIVWEKVP